MKKGSFHVILSAIFMLVTSTQVSLGQSETPKFEIGGQASFIRLQNPNAFFFSPVDKLSIGGGGRFTFNVHKYLALESEVNFFANDEDVLNRGSKIMTLFGVKSGKRWEKFGMFGKFRPGFTRGSAELTNCSAPDPASCESKKRSEFTMDIGGVFEYYHSKKLVVRFDAGDTLIRYKQRNLLDSNNGTIILFPIDSGGITHNLQISAGIGIRF